MRVLGIDPGTAIVGYGIIDIQGNRFTARDYGCVRTSSEDAMAIRLQQIFRELKELITIYQPDCLAIEELFFNKNTKTALAVGQARGVILLAAVENCLQAFEYTPLQVKQAVVGYGRAQKHQIQEMVRIFLNLKDIPKPDDAADALAVAICHVHSRNLNRIISNQSF